MNTVVRSIGQFRVCSWFQGCAAIGLLAFIIGFFYAAGSLAQQPGHDLGVTLNVSCSENSRLAPKTLRSPVLISPRNRKRAYAEVSASVALGNCANQSKLFIQSRGVSHHYNLVFLQEPTEMQRGNGIRIVDWSHDGRRLLFETIRWQYGSDARPHKDILIYDTGSGVFSPVRLEGLFKRFGESCFVTINPVGFSAENQAVLEVSARQDYDEERHPLKPRCAERKGLWSYDPSTFKMNELPSRTTVQRWGKVPVQQEPY
jgi:hypothetical protein